MNERFVRSPYKYAGVKPVITRDEYENRIRDLHNRMVDQFNDVLPQDIMTRFLSPALGTYQRGDYETALGYLSSIVTTFPDSETVLFPFLEITHRVVGTPVHEDDVRTEERLTSTRAWNVVWPELSAPVRLLYKALGDPRRTISFRCKYCTRFTRYVDPNVATFGMAPGAVGVDNYCDHCRRSYPMPDPEWDSIPGQAYIFYRRSVAEEPFYRDFLSRFDVQETNDEQFGGPLSL